jgi:hypothetical protein
MAEWDIKDKYGNSMVYISTSPPTEEEAEAALNKKLMTDFKLSQEYIPSNFEQGARKYENIIRPSLVGGGALAGDILGGGPTPTGLALGTGGAVAGGAVTDWLTGKNATVQNTIADATQGLLGSMIPPVVAKTAQAIPGLLAKTTGLGGRYIEKLIAGKQGNVTDVIKGGGGKAISQAEREAYDELLKYRDAEYSVKRKNQSIDRKNLVAEERTGRQNDVIKAKNAAEVERYKAAEEARVLAKREAGNKLNRGEIPVEDYINFPTDSPRPSVQTLLDYPAPKPNVINNVKLTNDANIKSAGALKKAEEVISQARDPKSGSLGIWDLLSGGVGGLAGYAHDPLTSIATAGGSLLLKKGGQKLLQTESGAAATAKAARSVENAIKHNAKTSKATGQGMSALTRYLLSDI